MALASCEHRTDPSEQPAFLYSDEFYGCDYVSDPTCKPRQPTHVERQQIQAAIDGMSCGQIQSYLNQQLIGNEIQVYEGDDGNWGDAHANGDIHVWIGNFSDPAFLFQTLAHEGAHLTYGADEFQADAWMDLCATA